MDYQKLSDTIKEWAEGVWGAYIILLLGSIFVVEPNSMVEAFVYAFAIACLLILPYPIVLLFEKEITIRENKGSEPICILYV
jgi:hypothetical protein